MPLLEIIRQIQNAKTEKNIVPNHTMIYEVIREANKRGISRERVLSEIDILERENRLKTGNTINSTFVKII